MVWDGRDDFGDKIGKGKKICEWDPYTLPVIAETAGQANYMDLVDGASLAETPSLASDMKT